MFRTYREDGRYLQNFSPETLSKGRPCSENITVDEKEDCVWFGFRCFRIGTVLAKLLMNLCIK
jgi:hypothetical protein